MVVALVPVTVAEASAKATSIVGATPVAKCAIVAAMSAAKAPLTKAVNSRASGRVDGNFENRRMKKPTSWMTRPEMSNATASGPPSNQSMTPQTKKRGAINTHTAPAVTPVADSTRPLESWRSSNAERLNIQPVSR